MAKRSIKYDLAKPNSGKGISSSQWNGFVGMHKDYYNGVVGGQPSSPILENSVVANAVLREGSEPIDPYTPVKLIRTVSLKDPSFNAPSFEVVPVTEVVDQNLTNNYGFTLAEGITESSGGRVVISGVAFVQVEKSDVSKTDLTGDGKWDSSYYAVDDGSIFADKQLIAPVGHFKILSWIDIDELNTTFAEDTDKVVLMVNMLDLPTTVSVATTASCAGVVDEGSGVFTAALTSAVVRYVHTNKLIGDPEEILIHNNTDAYTISVLNVSAGSIPVGTHTVTYSKEYNSFIFTGSVSTFHVELTKTGGTQGTSTTPCSWTYTVKLWEGDGSIIKADADIVTLPNHYRRPNLGQLEAATFGTATYNSIGELVIIDCNETLIFSTC